MIISRVFELDRPGVRVRNGRILLGGPLGRTVNIGVAGTRDSLWSRLFGERVHRFEVHGARGFQVYTGGEEATHALIFVDPSVDFLFSIDPTVNITPAIEVLWKGDEGAKLLLAPQGAEFSVAVEGVWATNSIGLNHSVGVPVFSRRTFFYCVGKGGYVYRDSLR